MRTYTIFVHDRRYTVPTLMAADFEADDGALAYAAEHLGASEDYTAIEVWSEDDCQLCRIEAEGGPA